jgi:hypothetical protein
MLFAVDEAAAASLTAEVDESGFIAGAAGRPVPR